MLHASLLPAKSNLKNSGQRPAKPSIKPTGAPSHTSQGSRSSSNKAAEMVLMGINRRGMSGPGMPNSGLSRYQTSCRHSNQHGCKVNKWAVLSSKDTGVASDQWLWGYRSSFMLCCDGLCREVRDLRYHIPLACNFQQLMAVAVQFSSSQHSSTLQQSPPAAPDSELLCPHLPRASASLCG